MNNLECATGVFAAHREARAWDDKAVATDLLAQLGLDPTADAKKAEPAVDPNKVTQWEVDAAKASAMVLTDAADAKEAALKAEQAEQAKAEADAAEEKAKAAKDDAEGKEPPPPPAPSKLPPKGVLPPPPAQAINDAPEGAIGAAPKWPARPEHALQAEAEAKAAEQ